MPLPRIYDPCRVWFKVMLAVVVAIIVSPQLLCWGADLAVAPLSQWYKTSSLKHPGHLQPLSHMFRLHFGQGRYADTLRLAELLQVNPGPSVYSHSDKCYSYHSDATTMTDKPKPKLTVFHTLSLTRRLQICACMFKSPLDDILDWATGLTQWLGTASPSAMQRRDKYSGQSQWEVCFPLRHRWLCVMVIVVLPIKSWYNRLHKLHQTFNFELQACIHI